MSATSIKPWVEVVLLHPVYRDSEQFFRSSHLTNGLRSLFQDVLSRLT